LKICCSHLLERFANLPFYLLLGEFRPYSRTQLYPGFIFDIGPDLFHLAVILKAEKPNNRDDQKNSPAKPFEEPVEIVTLVLILRSNEIEQRFGI
jgi:hypothetical protein